MALQPSLRVSGVHHIEMQHELRLPRATALLPSALTVCKLATRLTTRAPLETILIQSTCFSWRTDNLSRQLESNWPYLAIHRRHAR